MLNHLRKHFPRGKHYTVLENRADEIDRWLMKYLHYPEMIRSRRRIWNVESEQIFQIGRRLGWVPHSVPTVFFFESVKEEVAAAFTAQEDRIKGNLDTMEQALLLIQDMGLDHLQDRHPFSMSEGETKLVWFLCQWAKQPEYLIIENVFSGLSSDYSHRLLSFIQAIIRTGESESVEDPTFLIGVPASDRKRMAKVLSPPDWTRIEGFPSDV